MSIFSFLLLVLLGVIAWNTTSTGTRETIAKKVLEKCQKEREEMPDAE